MKAQGLLLLNLGTPDAPTPEAVRRYLREFLSDPRVIDIHPIARFLLLNLIILPLRPRRSAEAYQKIWTRDGSPLLLHGRGLAQAVQARLGDGWKVRLAMRYGNPSLQSALSELTDCERVVALPLYPQYSSASTGSSLEKLYQLAATPQVTPNLSVVPPFFRDPGYLACFIARSRTVIAKERPDHVVFSYHGLPERQVKKCDASQRHCLVSADCCSSLSPVNQNCYRAQCYDTSRSLALALGLRDGESTTCFQSRLGRTPWIRPYSDETIDSLLAAGKKRLVVVCPAFVADCLETIEEIGIRAKEDFVSRGGESLTLVPSLNSDDDWADAVTAMVRRAGDPKAHASAGTNAGDDSAQSSP